jgi:hypothetical protein
MSISANLMDAMILQAHQWWIDLSPAEQMQRTGTATEKEAERRFDMLCIADQWHLSQGHIETVANFNWGS